MKTPLQIPVGTRFGRLVVLGRESKRYSNGNIRSFFLCHCDCGKDKSINGSSLVANRSHSCGCLIGDSARKHGDAWPNKTPEYSIWSAILRRCTKKEDKAWKHYGGRGITICERWLDYRNFISDVGRRPEPHLTLDRIDNNKGYEPGNVRWATRDVQNRNSRRNVMLTIGDETMCVKDWSRRFGIPLGTFTHRIKRAEQLQWSI